MHAPRDRQPCPDDEQIPVEALDFDPDRDAILPVDDCWLVEARLLSRCGATRSGPIDFADAYARAVDALARAGYGCVPDPAVGDPLPDELVATTVVYRIESDARISAVDPDRELHLRLVCAMARTDGAFVGSELAVALELADRLATTESQRARYRAIVHELFINASSAVDPLSQLRAMPRTQALDVLDTLVTTAWADGLLRDAERTMLERVHVLLDVPLEQLDVAAPAARFVEDDRAA